MIELCRLAGHRSRDERGMSVVEYTVAIALVAAAAIVGIDGAKGAVDDKYDDESALYYDGFDAPVVQGGGAAPATPPTSAAAGPGPTSTSVPATTTTVPGSAGAHVSSIVVVTSANPGNSWNAAFTITIVNDGGSPVANAVVTGAWTASNTYGSPAGGPSCTTAADGTCTVTRTGLHKNTNTLTWSVVAVGGVDSQGTHSPASAQANNPLA